MSRIDQSIIDKYFKGDRAKYVASLQQSRAAHVEQTKSAVGAEKTKADALTAKLDTQIEDNQ